jgi:hypothetical protein
MGLREKKSNLKNSKYIPDMQGGGSSGLPYVKIALPEDSPAGEYLAGIARTSADFPLRGGTYSTVASTEDYIRVSRFLNDFPKGALFTSKQVGLQKSNPKIETGQLGSRLNTQTYNLNANLKAQVAEQGTGVHINRAGFNTNELGTDRNKYAYIASHKSTNDNRLVSLFNSKISGDTSSNLNSNIDKLGISNDSNALFDYTGGPGSLYGDGNTYISRVVDTNSQIASFEKGQINYRDALGASVIARTKAIPGLFTKKPPVFNSPENQISPNSNFKFGSTSLTQKSIFDTSKPLTGNFNLQPIPETPQKVNLEALNVASDFEEGFMGGTGKPKNLAQQSDPRFIRPEQSIKQVIGGTTFSNTLAYTELLSSKEKSTQDSPATIKDFRYENYINNDVNSIDYTNPNVNISTRIGIGNPGARPQKDRINPYTEFKGGQDKVNMSPIYRHNDALPVEQDSDDVRDIIKFVIEVIDNDNPSITDRMHFRAYITGLSDNFTPTWNGQKYMGRGEDFYTYQGFNREVSFQFKIAAQSVQEMEKLYQKLNYLASTLLPDYSGKGFMRGNLHKLTIGEYFYRTPGIIKSMNITVEDNYSWEIKMKQPELKTSSVPNQLPIEDQLQMEVPQLLNVSMTFTPILKTLPKKGIKSPIITSHGPGAVANNYLDRVEELTYVKFPKPTPTDGDPELPSKVNTDNN